MAKPKIVVLFVASVVAFAIGCGGHVPHNLFIWGGAGGVGGTGGEADAGIDGAGGK